MLAALAVAALLAASPRPDLTALLRAKDQALLDAVAPGDRAVWDAALTADFIYVDENGAVLDRSTLLATMKPLPAGTTGRLRITSYSVRRSGDTALVIHRNNELENYHGNPLHAEYLMTEAWRLEHGAWKLALVHAYVVPHDPPVMVLPQRMLAGYTGTYRAAPDLTLVVRRSGDHLTGSTDGGPARVWRAEVPDMFFVAGRTRTRYVFQRNQAGTVIAVADRREGRDLLWKRVGR